MCTSLKNLTTTLSPFTPFWLLQFLHLKASGEDFDVVFIIYPSQLHGAEDKILRVGEELRRETLQLQGGSRFYQLENLKPHTWYEVKISYPASIPAIFSIQLQEDKSKLLLNNNRRLLNTEKLIFKSYGDEDKHNVLLVTVEPEGFPAIPHVQERQFIIFNIVCDELLLGIPHKAWWVVVLALLCLCIAFIIPSFLPPYLLPKNQVPRSTQHVSKTS